MNAADYDSPLLYYDYSLDGGVTYSRREVWPDCDALTGAYSDTFTLNLQIPSGTKPTVAVRAYNMFDLFLESNYYQSPEAFAAKTEIPASSENTETDSNEQENQINKKDLAESVLSENVAEEQEVSLLTFLEICLVIVILIFIILLVSQLIAYHSKKRHRLQRRNDAGSRRDQHR